ncbi:MAG: hypothetical protein WC584_05345 [Candidatus Pacearchaeota archaeon]
MNAKDSLISAMIVRCGFNPESLIKKVEEGEVEQIKYECGGIYIFKHKNIISVGVKNLYFSNDLIWYQWRCYGS